MRSAFAVTTPLLLLLGSGVAEAADPTQLAETGGFLLGQCSSLRRRGGARRKSDPRLHCCRQGRERNPSHEPGLLSTQIFESGIKLIFI